MKKKFKITIEHACDGFDDYNEELFNKSLPYLLKVANTLKNMNMFPRIGELLYADGTVNDEYPPGSAPETGYTITYIIYYEDSVKLLVNDKY